MPTYPADFAVMRQALFDWVSAELGGGWTVVHAPQDGDGRRRPAPAKPWAQIRMIGVPQAEGRAFTQLADGAPGECDHYTRNVGTMTVEVQLFADTDVRGTLTDLRASLCREYPVLDDLRAAGLVSIEALAQERDLSAVFAGENEFRYVLEVPFRVETRRVVTNYPVIESIGPTGITVN